jgi:hypothetical protein
MTNSRQPRFEWTAVSGAISYELQLGGLDSPSTVLNASVTSFTPPSPLLMTVYFWRVRAIGSNDVVSAWSEMWTVTINAASSASPSLTLYTTNTPTLTWNRVTGVAGYEIQVDNNRNFSSPEYVNSTVPAGTLEATTTVLPNGVYYWRVRVLQADSLKWGGWSAIGSFTVEAA